MGTKVVLKQTEIRTCDICEAPMDHYAWPCWVCGKDICENCRSLYRAGIGDSQVRPVCQQCCDANPFPHTAVGVLVLNYKDEAETLRRRYETAIENEWIEYKERFAK
jgi:hypothetical protein